MARILVNYIYNKEKDEFKILNSENIFADMKVAVLETEDEINTPLVVPIKGIATVVDRKTYELIHKRFYLSADEKGNVMENPKGTEVWLPKDTDISQLKYINGNLVKVEKPTKPEIEQNKKSKPKN